MKKQLSNADRWSWSGYGAVALYALCGLALILWPNMAIDILGYALAAALCLVGVYHIISYFREDMMDSIMSFRFATGLAAIAIGIVLFCNPSALAQVYTFIFAAALVLGGLIKVQMALDMHRMKAPRWWCVLLGAAASIVLGVLIFANITSVQATLVLLIGIFMLVEAAIDLLTLIMLHRRIKLAFKPIVQAVQAAAAIQPDPVPPVETVTPQPIPVQEETKSSPTDAE